MKNLSSARCFNVLQERTRSQIRGLIYRQLEHLAVACQRRWFGSFAVQEAAMHRQILLIAVLGLFLGGCVPYSDGGAGYYRSEVYTSPAPYYAGGGSYYSNGGGYYTPPRRYYAPPARYYQPTPRYYHQPRVYQPAPRYYQPAPRYYQARPDYRAHGWDGRNRGGWNNDNRGGRNNKHGGRGDHNGRGNHR